jgi:HK97 family phage major capsid protein
MTRALNVVAQERREVETRIRSMRDEVEELTATRDAGEGWTDGRAERLERVEAGIEKALARYEALSDEERDAIRDWVTQHPTSVEEAVPSQRREERVAAPGGPARSRALRVVEGAKYLSARASDRLDALIRDADKDPGAVAARYLAAVADPLYASAFWKTLRSASTAHLDMTPEELRAMQSVRTEQRAMSLGSDEDGGYAVPFQLDPTIILTSDGVTNPLRSVARVETIVGKEWQGLTSDGVVVTRTTENDEATDDSPEFDQPTVRTNRVQAFIPFSYELGQDWGGLRSQLTTLLADAKDAEEAESFLNGDGTGTNCSGLLGTLPNGSLVDSTTTNAFAVADVYKLIEEVPARHQPRLQALASLSIINKMRRFVGGGSTTEVPVVNESLDRLVGKPLHELSTMGSTTTTGSKPLIVGDFSQFLIVDRIGMSVELIPHLFGENGRPTGQRGLFGFWRNNTLILNPNGIRALKVKA